MRSNAAGAAQELRLFVRELDADVLAPRVAALVFLTAGLLALAAGLLLPALRGEPSIGAIAGLAALFGAVGIVLPWERYDRRVQLVLPIFAFVLFAWGGAIARGTPEPYLAMLPLPFVFVGLSQPSGTASALAPVAAGALIVADRLHFDATLLSTLVFALPMLVLVGEALSFAQVRRGKAEARV